MELERRVKTLEQEVKILKNQIQTILREIQEQVLVHYYPSLRSDSSVVTQQVAQPVPPQVAQPVPPQVAQPVPPQVAQPVPPQVAPPVPPQVAPQAPARVVAAVTTAANSESDNQQQPYDEEYHGEKLPSIKLVSLGEIRRQQTGMKSFFDEEPAEPLSGPENGNGIKDEASELRELAAWMVGNTAEMGIAKTRDLLQMRANGSGETSAPGKLMGFLELFSNQEIDHQIFQEMVESFLRLNKASE